MNYNHGNTNELLKIKFKNFLKKRDLSVFKKMNDFTEVEQRFIQTLKNIENESLELTAVNFMSYGDKDICYLYMDLINSIENDAIEENTEYPLREFYNAAEISDELRETLNKKVLNLSLEEMLENIQK